MSIFTTSSWFLLHVPVSSLICLNLGGTSHHIPICSSAPARLVQVVTFSSRALPEGQARGTGGVDTPGYPDTYLVLSLTRDWRSSIEVCWINCWLESNISYFSCHFVVNLIPTHFNLHIMVTWDDVCLVFNDVNSNILVQFKIFLFLQPVILLVLTYSFQPEVFLVLTHFLRSKNFVNQV